MSWLVSYILPPQSVVRMQHPGLPWELVRYAEPQPIPTLPRPPRAETAS